jgi:hypothetical protein
LLAILIPAKRIVELINVLGEKCPRKAGGRIPLIYQQDGEEEGILKLDYQPNWDCQGTCPN